MALKSLALSLPRISHELLIDQNRFLPDLSYTFSQYLTACFLTAVRHEVKNLESYVVEKELELAISLALYVLWSLGNLYNMGTLSWFSLALTPKCRAV